jgi:hypothetical protein
MRFVDDPDGGGLGVCVRFGAFQSQGGGHAGLGFKLNNRIFDTVIGII